MANGFGDTDKDKKASPPLPLPPGAGAFADFALKIGQGILSGRRQAAVDRAAREGVQLESRIAPESDVLFSQDVDVLPDGERLAAAVEFQKAVQRGRRAPRPKALEEAQEALEQGNIGNLVRSVIKDPIGTVGFSAAESLARSPMALVLSIIPKLGSGLGSFDANQRIGFTEGLREQIKAKGGDPANLDDVIEAFSDEQALQAAFDKATKGASAAASTEVSVEALADLAAKRIPNPILRTMFRVAAEAGGEALSETARQIATGEDVDLLEAVWEGFVTLGQSGATALGAEVISNIDGGKVSSNVKETFDIEETEAQLPKVLAQGVRLNRLYEAEPRLRGEVESADDPRFGGQGDAQDPRREVAKKAVEEFVRIQQQLSRSVFGTIGEAQTQLLQEISNSQPSELAGLRGLWDAQGDPVAARAAIAWLKKNPEVKEAQTQFLREKFGDEILVFRGGHLEQGPQGWSIDPTVSQRFAEGTLQEGPDTLFPGKRAMQQGVVRPEHVEFVGNIGEGELVIDSRNVRDIQPTSIQQIKDELIVTLEDMGYSGLAAELGALSNDPREIQTLEATVSADDIDLSQFSAMGFLGEDFIDFNQLPSWIRTSVVQLEELEDPAQFDAKRATLQGEVRGSIQALQQAEKPRLERRIQQLSRLQQSNFKPERAEQIAEQQRRLDLVDEQIDAHLDLLNTLEGLTFESLKEGRGGIDLSQFSAMGVDINRIFEGGEPVRPRAEASEPTNTELVDEEARLVPPPSDEELAQFTGSSRAIVLRARRLRGWDDLPPAQQRAWNTAAKMALQKKVPEQALSMAQSLINRPRPLFDWEVVGMTFRKAALEQFHDEQMAKAEELINLGQTGPAQVLKNRADAALAEIDIIERGVQRGGSETARGLSAFGAGYRRPDMTLANLRRQVKIRKGRPLTEKEETRIRELHAKLQRAEQALEAANRKAEEAELEVKKRLAARAVRQNRTKEELTQEKIDAIRAEREEIKKQIRGLGFRANDAIGATAELTFLAGKLAKTYIQEGLVNLESLVAKLMTDLPDLSREDAYEAVATLELGVQDEMRKRAQAELDDVQKAQKVIQDFENLAATDPDKAKDLLKQIQNRAYQKQTDNERLLAIEKQIEKVKQKLEDVRPKEEKLGPRRSAEEVNLLEELRELRALLSYEQRIANLEDQIATGAFREPIRRRRDPDTPEIRDAKIRLLKTKAQIRHLTQGQAEFEFRDFALEPKRIMTEMMATGDFSSVLRQGLGLIMAKPNALPHAYAKAFQAFFKEGVADLVDLQILESPEHALRVEAGLMLTFREGLNTREEIFQSKLLQRVPSLGEVLESSRPDLVKAGLIVPGVVKSWINAAERHWTTFLNLMRVSVFDEFVAQNPDADIETLRQLAKNINALSGRANLELGAGTLAGLFAFAPRFAASRIEAPARAAATLRNPQLRKLAAVGLLRTAAWGATWFGLASLAGIQIGWDHRDSDFGKIILGNTRIDIWGGFQQPYSTLLRIILSGEELRGRELDGYDLLTRFALYKISPLISLPMALFTGEDVVGNKVTTLEAIGKHFTPFVLQDAYETGKRTGLLGGVAGALGSWHGLSISTFGGQFKAGDINPILNRVNYKPRVPNYPEEIDNNPERKEQLDIIFEALVARKIRENKALLETVPPSVGKAMIQGYARDVRASMSQVTRDYSDPEAIEPLREAMNIPTP